MSIFRLSIKFLFSPIAFILLYLSSFSALAQNGYVITTQGETKKGWLKTEVGYKDRGVKILFFESRKAKDPEIFYAFDLKEYAVSNDTIVILNIFYPFEDQELLYEQVEAKVIRQGKVDLLFVEDKRKLSSQQVNVRRQTSGMNVANIYILKKGDLVEGVSPKFQLFVKTMNNFFYDNPQLMDKIRKKRLRYSDLFKIVESYNN